MSLHKSRTEWRLGKIGIGTFVDDAHPQIGGGLTELTSIEHVEILVGVLKTHAAIVGNVELLGLIKDSVGCEVKERSTRIGSSHLPMDHPAVVRGLSLGLEPFGSPTTSNQALSPFPTLKIGPGDSSRSHGPDEYILLDEISSGVETYIKLLDGLVLE